MARQSLLCRGNVRHDTERNHTATHLLHAALRETLGEHVHQAGSLVTPDRLRFDFTHHGPLTAEQLGIIETRVNDGIWQAIPVSTCEKSYADAVAEGAMALFGEKYGDVVRVVEIEDRSIELCGGTHLRNSAEIGLFRILSESGVAAGVRRIEALTGPRAFQLLAERERGLMAIANRLKVPAGGSGSSQFVEQVSQRVDSLLEERRDLERKLDEAQRSSAGSGLAGELLKQVQVSNGVRYLAARVEVDDMKLLQLLGDQVRELLGDGVGVLGAALADGKGALLAVCTDSVRERGLRADVLVRDVAAAVGGRGGGKAHMAQAGVDPSMIDRALASVSDAVARLSVAG